MPPRSMGNGLICCAGSGTAAHVRHAVNRLDPTLVHFRRPVKPHRSRQILPVYGNMGSASALFVLKHILGRLSSGVGAGERVCAMAFGPGLTVEFVLMIKVGVTGSNGGSMILCAAVPIPVCVIL